MMWVGHGAHMGEMRGAYRVFVEKLEGKRLLGRLMPLREDNIKTNPQSVGRKWIKLIWRRIENSDRPM
jgi:hypothetical protein